MLLSLSLIFLLGMSLAALFQKAKLPGLLGMIFTGMLLGPYMLNLLDPTILGISAELRKIALIIILTRAGLNLDIADLKKVGRPAILMCFVPACIEILGMILLAPKLLGITVLEAAVMGTVVAAVSPAVIVPRMLNFMGNGYGKEKSIPQMIMAAASVDDVFVIVLFTTFSGLLQGGDFSPIGLLSIPTSIIFGILGGIIAGYAVNLLFNNSTLRASAKVLVILSVSFLLVTLEDNINGIIGFSGLLAVMSLGATLKILNINLSTKLSSKFSKLWVCAEVLLFVLVGATVNISYAVNAGVVAVVLILLVTVFRVLGVVLSLLGTNLNNGERLFCAFSFIPKATVQAAIGGLPLAMGLSCGDIVLTVAVLSILITAPLGAILIDSSYKKLLTKD